MTEAGVKYRALKRKRFREELVVVCSAHDCQEEIDQDELTHWKIDRLRNGQKLVARCPKCEKEKVPRAVPRCTLTCPECDGRVYSEVLRGQAHEHIAPNGQPCGCRFRWAEGEAIRRTPAEWR